MEIHFELNKVLKYNQFTNVRLGKNVSIVNGKL